MYAFLLGLGVFLLVMFGLRYLASADTGRLARTIRKYSWIALLILAVSVQTRDSVRPDLLGSVPQADS